MDGFETAKLIRGRERSQATPIIFPPRRRRDDLDVPRLRGRRGRLPDEAGGARRPESKVAIFVELHMKSERLRDSEDKLRRLAAHLISVREEERAHIAREIHDELGQVLTGIKMEVGWLQKRIREPQLLEKTESMSKLIDSTVQTVRKIATGLRPEMLDDMAGRRGRLAGEGVPEAHRHPLPHQAAAGEQARPGDLDLRVPHLPGDPDQHRAPCARHAGGHRARRERGAHRARRARQRHRHSRAELNGRKSLGLLGMQERALLFGGEVGITGTPGREPG